MFWGIFGLCVLICKEISVCMGFNYGNKFSGKHPTGGHGSAGGIEMFIILLY